MYKKIVFSILFACTLAPLAYAQSASDFSTMSPTVKIKSYKKLPIDQMLGTGSGSGTFISADGFILTNHHVIYDETLKKPYDAFEVCISFKVSEEPECRFLADLITSDRDIDLALLKIQPKDVFGKALPDLNFLNYKNNSSPKEETRITVQGFPGSGGDTITITQGQISGFEQFNDYSYFKTDTDFDSGSSGGTALDQDGNFIGVPTYIRSYNENVGFFLDLREAKKWIADALSKNIQPNGGANFLLTKKLIDFYQANQTLSYIQSQYPFVQIDLPEGWSFLGIEPNGIFASQKNVTQPVSFSLQTLPYQFRIDQAYLNELDKELQFVRDNFPDYKKEEVEFAGQSAWKITYTSYSSFNTTYYIPYGYSIVVLSYALNLDQLEKQSTHIQPVLDSVQFTQPLQSEPQLDPVISFSDPHFQIESMGNWRLQKNTRKTPSDLLVLGAQRDNFEGKFMVYYDEIPRDDRKLSNKERLEEVVESLEGRKIVYKNDQVVLGGLEGFLYTFEYEGDEYQEIRRNLTIQLRDGDNQFYIEYDDLIENFDKNLAEIEQMLETFRVDNVNSNLDLKNSYGNLSFTFEDIQFHPFAVSISELADKGIVSGRTQKRFVPEAYVTRAEAVKWIFKSKNHLEKEKESDRVVDFRKYNTHHEDGVDFARNRSKNYIYYGREQGFLNPNSKTFKPNESINLAEALKVILEVYEIPIWQKQTDPWFKKYVDKGYQLRIIPYGYYVPHQPLTRAELARMINTIYKQAK